MEQRPNKTEWITIKNRFTGKKVFFTAIYLCAKYLNISEEEVIRAKTDKTILNNTWYIEQPK